MVFHWPEAGQGDALAASMREMREALLGLPGCLAVEPPYVTEDGSCLVGISKWASREAFFASALTKTEQRQLNALLRKLMLAFESREAEAQ